MWPVALVDLHFVMFISKDLIGAIIVQWHIFHAQCWLIFVRCSLHFVLGKQRYSRVSLEICLIERLLARYCDIYLAINSDILLARYFVDTTISKSTVQRVESTVHINALIICFQVAILDSQNVQFSLRFSLLTSQSLFNICNNLFSISKFIINIYFSINQISFSIVVIQISLPNRLPSQTFFVFCLFVFCCYFVFKILFVVLIANICEFVYYHYFVCLLSKRIRRKLVRILDYKFWTGSLCSDHLLLLKRV